MNTKAYDDLMSQVTTKGEYPREGYTSGKHKQQKSYNNSHY